MDAVLVLDELAETEVGVLRTGRRPSPLGSTGLAPPAEHELDFRGEKDDERQPERHPLLQVVDEQPRKHEDERGQPHDELHPAAAHHSATVRPGARGKVARVPATMMDGKALASEIRADVAREVAELGDIGLATVLVGDDPASHIYVTNKHKAAEEVGIESTDTRLTAETPREELAAVLQGLGADPAISGILLQIPDRFFRDVVDFELSAQELAAIDALDTGKRGGPEPSEIDLANYGRPIPEA